jgi:hypothetical protein
MLGQPISQVGCLGFCPSYPEPAEAYPFPRRLSTPRAVASARHPAAQTPAHAGTSRVSRYGCLGCLRESRCPSRWLAFAPSLFVSRQMEVALTASDHPSCSHPNTRLSPGILTPIGASYSFALGIIATGRKSPDSPSGASASMCHTRPSSTPTTV